MYVKFESTWKKPEPASSGFRRFTMSKYNGCNPLRYSKTGAIEFKSDTTPSPKNEQQIQPLLQEEQIEEQKEESKEEQKEGHKEEPVKELVIELKEKEAFFIEMIPESFFKEAPTQYWEDSSNHALSEIRDQTMVESDHTQNKIQIKPSPRLVETEQQPFKVPLKPVESDTGFKHLAEPAEKA